MVAVGAPRSHSGDAIGFAGFVRHRHVPSDWIFSLAPNRGNAKLFRKKLPCCVVVFAEHRRRKEVGWVRNPTGGNDDQ